MFNNKGFAAFLTSIILLSSLILLGVFTSLLVLQGTKASYRSYNSVRAYYLAESGIEDALLRFRKDLPWQSSYTFQTDEGEVEVSISDKVGGARTIRSIGDVEGQKRKVEIVYEVTSDEISFYYGAQAGEGGILMGNNARIKGNVYSNGSIIAVKGGKGQVDNTAIVAQNGNRIEGLIVGENAKAYNCDGSDIGGDFTYVEGGGVGDCTIGGAVSSQAEEIPVEPLPISQDQVDNWKTDIEEEGNIIAGDHQVPARETTYLGPVKIEGNLSFGNRADLRITGTVWVTGGIDITNNAVISLDPETYGSSSGIMMADGKVKVRNNAHLSGTGQEGSYLMILSTHPEKDDLDNPAVRVNNNAEAAIFYTTQGLIVLRNNIDCREVTGYKVYLDNNAVVEYESGLAESNFVSGTGGGWSVSRWEEIK